MKILATRSFAPLQESPTEEADASAELARDLRRIRDEEQAKIDRRRQEEVARLRELARFD
jgi:hypothetical protein